MAIRQDVEAIALTHQASVVGNNSSTAQKTAGLSAWIATNDDFGSGGASGGYNNSTHVVDAPTVGVGRALSWAKVTTQLLALFNKRADTSIAMSTGALIQGINQAIVAGTIKVATPQATMSANNPPAAQTGQGWFSGIISDFGFQITFVPNRTQQTYTGGGTSSNVTACVDLFLLDVSRIAMAYLVGYNVVDLGPKSALRTERHLAVEWLTKPYREDAQAVIRDLKASTAVTA
jgi:hypothetical protein